MGESPYLSALHSIRDEVYGHPSAGFRTRLIILLSLTTSFAFIGLVDLAFVIASFSRDESGGFWFWRKSTVGASSRKGSEGETRTVTIFNIKLIVVPLIVFEGIYDLIWLVDEYRIHCSNATARYHFAISSFLPFPVAAAGYFFSIGTLTATTFILPEKQQAKYARAINWINSYGLIFSAVLLVAAAVFRAVAGTRYFYAYETLEIFLRDAQRGYNGEPLGQIQRAEFDRQEFAFAETRNLYRTAATFQWATLPIYIIALIIINFFSLKLSKALKVHLEESRRNLGLSLETTYPGNLANDSIALHELDLPASECIYKRPRTSSSAAEDEEHDIEVFNQIQRSSISSSRPETRTISMGYIQKLARSRRLKDSASLKKEANRILEVQRTRRELQIMSLAFVVLALGALATTSFLCIGTGMFLLTRGHWPIYEALWYCYAWGNGLSLPPIGLSFLYIQARAWWIWRKRNDDPAVIEIEQVVQERSDPNDDI